jgi:ABC-type polysaccharide/polyol phosphate transport system ATPase subunit
MTWLTRRARGKESRNHGRPTLLGDNGAGKSTTMSLIGGLYRPTPARAAVTSGVSE